MSGHRPGTGGGALFFRDADAEKVFILAFLLTLPAACWTLDSRKLLPTRFFGST